MDDTNPFKIPKKISDFPTTVEGCHDFIRELLGTISELFKRVDKIEEIIKIYFKKTKN